MAIDLGKRDNRKDNNDEPKAGEGTAKFDLRKGPETISPSSAGVISEPKLESGANRTNSTPRNTGPSGETPVQSPSTGSPSPTGNQSGGPWKKIAGLVAVAALGAGWLLFSENQAPKARDDIKSSAVKESGAPSVGDNTRLNNSSATSTANNSVGSVVEAQTNAVSEGNASGGAPAQSEAITTEVTHQAESNGIGSNADRTTLVVSPSSVAEEAAGATAAPEADQTSELADTPSGTLPSSMTDAYSQPTNATAESPVDGHTVQTNLEPSAPSTALTRLPGVNESAAMGGTTTSGAAGSDPRSDDRQSSSSTQEAASAVNTSADDSGVEEPAGKASLSDQSDRVVAVFEKGSALLDAVRSDKLDEVAADAARSADLRIVVEGYASSDGALDYNKALSERRAESVRRYLTERGASAVQIETRGMGTSNPVADNGTIEGRRKNRRAEISISR